MRFALGGSVAAVAGALLLAGLLAIAGAPPPQAAAQSGDQCLSADPPPVSAPPQRLRFGITPLAAGTANSQTPPKAEDPAASIAALQRLRPGRRQLVMRLNRM